VATERRAAKPLLEKILAATQSQGIRKQAQTLLQQIPGLGTPVPDSKLR